MRLVQATLSDYRPYDQDSQWYETRIDDVLPGGNAFRVGMRMLDGTTVKSKLAVVWGEQEAHDLIGALKQEEADIVSQVGTLIDASGST